MIDRFPPTPPAFVLREYQREAISQAVNNLRLNPIIVLPTGGGKTATAAQMVKELGLPTLWLAHRTELVAQAGERLRLFGLPVGIIQSGFPRYPSRLVQVASVQTLCRRDLPKVRLIVVDEAHNFVARTFRKVLEAYPGIPRVGLTATPFRLDGKPLGDLFGHIVVTAYADELVKVGTLIEPRVYAPPPAGLDGIGKRCGDFDQKKLGAAVDKTKLIGDIVTTWQRHAAGLTTLCFAVNVNHSRHIVDQFIAAGIAAEHIDGETPKHLRAAILARLASGKTIIVSNVGIATEGYDLPRCQCIIMARPTDSLCLHLQSSGRAMRSCDGKTSAIILDHAGNFLRHGRVTRRLEYSLSGKVKAKEGKDAGPPTLKACPGCNRVLLSRRPACPDCGHVFPFELPEVAEGELTEFRDADQAAVAAPIEIGPRHYAFLRKMQSIAQEKGFLPGWAGHRFKDRFGIWPPEKMTRTIRREAVPA